MNNLIYLQVDGADTTAWIMEISNRHHNMFKVCFSNGYENIFFTDVETGRWIEEDLGFTDLAQVVGRHLRPFLKSPVHVPRVLVWHHQVYDKKILNFGFFCYNKGKHKLYEIYGANRKYLYTLMDMENDEWQILGNSTISINRIDPVFVEQVIQILPLYSEDYR